MKYLQADQKEHFSFQILGRVSHSSPIREEKFVATNNISLFFLLRFFYYEISASNTKYLGLKIA